LQKAPGEEDEAAGKQIEPDLAQDKLEQEDLDEQGQKGALRQQDELGAQDDPIPREMMEQKDEKSAGIKSLLQNEPRCQDELRETDELGLQDKRDSQKQPRAKNKPFRTQDEQGHATDELDQQDICRRDDDQGLDMDEGWREEATHQQRATPPRVGRTKEHEAGYYRFI